MAVTFNLLIMLAALFTPFTVTQAAPSWQSPVASTEILTGDTVSTCVSREVRNFREYHDMISGLEGEKVDLVFIRHIISSCRDRLEWNRTEDFSESAMLQRVAEVVLHSSRKRDGPRRCSCSTSCHFCCVMTQKKYQARCKKIYCGRKKSCWIFPSHNCIATGGV